LYYETSHGRGYGKDKKLERAHSQAAEKIVESGVELYADLCSHAEEENSSIFPLIESELSAEDKKMVKKMLDEIGYFWQ
jgi:hemerythrin-like domain-containing protein